VWTIEVTIQKGSEAICKLRALKKLEKEWLVAPYPGLDS
jgi:hypothetical protein